mmetsp:Transcript_35875/g.78600  ORF Transcript_35875/g.78600 Transcript_35875/m.78600 type:complete len:200 (+) Transcript_35875:958-1557(+)
MERTLSSRASIVIPPPPSQSATWSPSSSAERNPSRPHMTQESDEASPIDCGGASFLFFPRPPRDLELLGTPAPWSRAPSSASIRSISDLSPSLCPSSLQYPVISRISSRKNSCTGNVRPGMLTSAGTSDPTNNSSSSSPSASMASLTVGGIPTRPIPDQYTLSSCVCIVADINTTCKSLRNVIRFLKAIIRNSVYLSLS